MKKYKKNTSSLPKALFISVMISFAVLLAGCLILSFVIVRLKNPTEALPIASLALFLGSGFLSGFLISRQRENGGPVFALLCSVIFIFIFLLVSLIITKGHIPGVLFMNSLCYMLISALAAFLGKKREKVRRSHR